MNTASKRALLAAVLLAAVLLTGCNGEGLTSMAADGSHTTVIHNDGMYVVDNGSGDAVYFGRVANAAYAPVLSLDGNTVYYIDRALGRVLGVPGDASAPARTMTSERAVVNNSLLAMLPSGDLFFFSYRENQRRYFVQVIDPDTTQTLQQVEGIETAFVSANAIAPRPDDGTPGDEWLVPNLQPGQLKLVFLAQGFLFLYEADESGFNLVETLPRRVDDTLTALLRTRAPNSITSGLLTDDGRRLVLTTRNGSGTTTQYSLYAIDLMSDDAPEALILDADAPTVVAVSPTGGQVVFESPGTPAVLVQYDFASGELTALGIGKYNPEWWR